MFVGIDHPICLVGIVHELEIGARFHFVERSGVLENKFRPDCLCDPLESLDFVRFGQIICGNQVLVQRALDNAVAWDKRMNLKSSGMRNGLTQGRFNAEAQLIQL